MTLEDFEARARESGELVFTRVIEFGQFGYSYTAEALQANAKFLGLELTPVNGVQAASFGTPRQRQRPQLSFDEDTMLSATHATDVDSIMAGKSYLLRVSYAVHSDKGCTYDPQGTGWRNLFVRDATDYDSPESYVALLCDNTYP